MEIATLLQHVFNRSSLNDIPLSALEDLTQKHPYFSAGHYFLSKKLGQENKDSAEYSRQKQKTNLYFHDTLWLHHLLNGSAGESAPLLNTEWEKAADTVEKESAGSALAAGSMEEELESLASLPVEDAIGEEAAPTGFAEDTIGEEATPTGFADDTIGEEAVQVAVAVAETTDEAVQEGSIEDPAENQPESASPEATDKIRESLAGPASEASAILAELRRGPKSPATPTENAGDNSVGFDPYHTIDYFASLGIRVSQDIKPDDKLGNQLKSFTQWLKAMKRFPTGEPDPTIAMQPYEAANIEKIAAHSIEEKDILTEAMAEVLVKQGKLDKARSVYHKLSLLNPDKNAYFAAKIEELKQY